MTLTLPTLPVLGVLVLTVVFNAVIGYCFEDRSKTGKTIHFVVSAVVMGLVIFGGLSWIPDRFSTVLMLILFFNVGELAGNILRDKKKEGR